MFEFLIILGISFLAFLVFSMFMNFCRRKQQKTPHGLTGMCHKNGGPTCGACQDKPDKSES